MVVVLAAEAAVVELAGVAVVAVKVAAVEGVLRQSLRILKAGVELAAEAAAELAAGEVLL